MKRLFSSRLIRLKIGDFATLQRNFTTEDVKSFSELLGDTNPIHLSDQAGKASRFGERIVHGTSYLSLFGTLCGTYLPGCIYISQEVRFHKPVYVDQKIEAKIQVKEIIEKKKIVKLATTIHNEDQIVTSGMAVILLERMVFD